MGAAFGGINDSILRSRISYDLRTRSMSEASSDDPGSWRSAIDASSGRTYWYHRTTRQTTWRMPDCLVEVQKTNKDNGGYKELINMLDGLATPSELIDLLDKPPVETQFEVMKIIFNCCLPSTASAWAQHSGFIDKLATIAIRTQSIDVRVLSLRILFGLAAAPDSAQAFRVSKGWISLADQVEKWNEPNTTILFSYIMAILCGGPLIGYIPRSLLHRLVLHLEARCSGDACAQDDELLIFIQHPNPSGSSLISSSLMGLLAKPNANSEMNLLPHTVFLVLARYAFQSKSASISFFKNGGFSLLQSVCTNDRFPESIRTEAIGLVRVAMRSSDYIQNSVLNCWIGLATDLSSAQQIDTTNGLMAASPIEVTERDVELRSTVGKKSVKMHSALLWMRCPGLRGIIEDLWVERRGGSNDDTNASNRGMEISLEASDEVIGAVHDYILTGLLAPLPLQSTSYESTKISDTAVGADLLELSKVACELEMVDFEHAISRHICQLLYWTRSDSSGHVDSKSEDEIEADEKLALQRLDHCLIFADKWGLTLLSKSLVTVQYYMSVESSMSSELEEENNKNSMILADTCFTPMKFDRRKQATVSVSLNRNHLYQGDDIVYASNAVTQPGTHPRLRNGQGHAGDDLHDQVIASLQEVSNAVYEDKLPDRSRVSQPASVASHPRKKVANQLHDGENVDAAYDHESHVGSYQSLYADSNVYDEYLEYSNKDSLVYAEQQSSKPKTPTTSQRSGEVSKGTKSSESKLRPAASSKPSNNDRRPPASNRSTGIPVKNSSTSGKKTKAHGGMYELLMAAGGDLLGDDNKFPMAGSIDSSIGDYSALYADLAHKEDFDDTYRDDDGVYLGDSDSEPDDSGKPAYIPARTPGKMPGGNVTRSISSGASPARGKAVKPLPAASRLGGKNRNIVQEPVEVGVYEFDPRRDSLVSAPKMSAAEKRLNDLSQPKKLREKTARNKKDEPAEEDEDDDANKDVDRSIDKAVILEHNLPARAASGFKGRDVVPPLPAAGPAACDLPTPPLVDSSVRASLKLLKSKRRSSEATPPPDDNSSTVPSVSVDLSIAAINSRPLPKQIVQTNELEQKRPPTAFAAAKPAASMPAMSPAPAALSNCSRSSGCKCALCAMPMDTSYRPGPALTYERFKSDDEDERGQLIVRETELQRKRKEANSKKAAEGKKSGKSSTSNKWKLQSQQFRAAMRAARGAGTSGVEEEQIPTVDENGVPFGMVHCDGCGRNFNPEAGARHKLVCKNIKAKPKMLVRGGGRSAGMGKR